MDHLARITDCCISSAHVACDRFTNYPYWIFLYKLCILNGFPWIISAVQLSTVGFSFLVLDKNGFFNKIKKFYLCSYCFSSTKGSQSVAKT